MTGPINTHIVRLTSAFDTLPGSGVLSNANRTFTITGSTNRAHGTKSYAANAAVDKYFEILCGGDIAEHMVGLVTTTGLTADPHYPGFSSEGFGYRAFDGQTLNGGNAAYGASYGPGGDRIGVRLASGIVTYYKNGVSQGTAFDLVALGLGATLMYPAFGAGGTGGTVIGTIFTGSPGVVALPSGSTTWG